MALIVSKATQRRKAPFLPDEILEILKCKECDGYLSTPPILKHLESGSVCGECAKYISSEFFIRNTEYEVIASFVEFPCKNKGCHQRVQFGKFAEHEYDCLFRQYECPCNYNLSCTWQGCAQELGTHFSEKHRNFYLKGICFEPDIRTNCEQALLYFMNDNMYLIQTKCVVLQCKFWCLVRYIGKPKKSGLFKYKLEFRGNKTRKSFFTDESMIQTDISWCIDTSSALEINLSNLLKELCCPLELKCKIHIKKINS